MQSKGLLRWIYFVFMIAGGPPHKHFVNDVVIGNSGVGKTSLIQ